MNTSSQPATISWVDWAKTILITLVVYGHFRGKYDDVPGLTTIYSFHVPAFLMITGYLLSPGLHQTSWSNLWQRRLVVFIKTYVLFSLLSMVIWLSLSPSTLADIPRIAQAVLYGVDGRGNGLGHRNAPLWYFPFLVSSLILYWGVNRFERPWNLAALAASLAFAFLYDGPRLPWSMELAGIGAMMLWAGALLRQGEAHVHRQLTGLQGVIVILLLAFALWTLVRWNGKVNINNAALGRHPHMTLLAMLLGSAAITALSMKLPVTRFARWVAQHTLVIFATHLALVIAISPWLPKFTHPVPKAMLLGSVALIIVSLCAAFSQLISPLLQRVLARRR